MSKLVGEHMMQRFCAVCGCEYWMPTALNQECQREGKRKSWYCPNGHARVYSKGDRERLEEMRRERDLLKQREAQLHDQLRDASKIERKLKAERDRARKQLKNFEAPEGKRLVVYKGGKP